MTVTDKIYMKAIRVKGLLGEQFKNLNSKISFTFDAGTLRTFDLHLTVMAHWINNSWELCEHVLAFTEIIGKHTGANWYHFYHNLPGLQYLQL